MNRCTRPEIFDATVKMINGFKEYFLRHHQVVYENPSPGNKDGGISTLEEKSLGCTQKGGNGPVVDVLDYGARLHQPGLNLLNGPGNDIVACTALAASGAHLILFTTGRGTPLGAPVPTVKIAPPCAKKRGWITTPAGGWPARRWTNWRINCSTACSPWPMAKPRRSPKSTATAKSRFSRTA
jgi:altronate hydrolase